MSALTSSRTFARRKEKNRKKVERRKKRRARATARGKVRESKRRDSYRLDSGAIRSYVRDTKRALMREHTVVSGRQWVRLRKRLSREDRASAQRAARAA